MAEFRFPPLKLPSSLVSNCDRSYRSTALTDDAGARSSTNTRAFAPPSDKKKQPPCGNKCSDDKNIFVWGCDERVPGPTDVEVVKTTQPWQSVGLLSTGGTGCVISSTLVLTGAHVLLDKDLQLRKSKMIFSPGFTLGQCAFPPQLIDRVWFPEKYKFGGGENVKCYDWAIARLAKPTTAPPMQIGAIPIETVKAAKIFSVGYPAELSKVIWSTGPNGKVIDHFSDRRGPGQLLRTTLDASGGQSGSPVYVIQTQIRTVVGVMVGAPSCAEGANWVSFINSDALEKIEELRGGNVNPSGMVSKTLSAVPGNIICGTVDDVIGSFL